MSPDNSPALEEHIVGEQVGVDHALGQTGRPVPLEIVELARDLDLETRLDPSAPARPASNSGRQLATESAFARDPENPRPPGAASPGHCRARCNGRRRPARRQAVAKADQAAGRPQSERSACAVAAVDRRGTGHALGRQMLHQRQEERQIRGRHPLLVEGQDVAAALGDQAVVRVLDALRDALQVISGAEIVAARNAPATLVDRGVDRHRRRPARSARAPFAGRAGRRAVEPGRALTTPAGRGSAGS